MLHTKTGETLVGAFIALGLGALLVLALRVSNLNLSTLGGDKGYDLRAKFENIGGLKVRSPVKMAGVTVGRVATVDIDPQSFEAIAVLHIAPRYNRIPSDTSAKIYTAGLLGEQYISLEPGGDETFLKGGDQITLTQSAVVLEQVIGQFLYSKAAGGSVKE
jgi:phospholipid/cholesterol/gamma-HCH transport system substrate-binding protein